MLDLSEKKRALEQSLGDELSKLYFALLRESCLFKSNMSKVEFSAEALKLMSTPEQVRNHNQFVIALYDNTTKPKHDGQGAFEIADFSDYVQTTGTSAAPPDFENRVAAYELLLPDLGFVNTRVAIHAWEHGLKGAEERVADVLIHLCQSYVKNIICAMMTRKEGYKVRDRFQHSVGLPVPDPFVRNTHNIVDSSQESKTEISANEDSFMPAVKPSQEVAEQQTAFAYACSKRKRSDGKLTVKLLYDTLAENPNVIGLHSVNSINLLQVGLELDSGGNK